MAVACGDFYTMAVAEDGRLWACGNAGKNDHHKVGRGTRGSELQPLLVGRDDHEFDGEGVLMVAAGGHHAACVTTTGKLWVWGYNSHGQLGLSTGVVHPSSIQFDGFGKVGAVYRTCECIDRIFL